MVVDSELRKFSLGNFKKSVFQSRFGRFLLNRGLVEECIPPSRVQKGKEIVMWLFYEKSAHVVVRFRAQNILSRQFHEMCFSISSWTFSTELRFGGGVYLSRVRKKNEFVIWLFYEKSARVVVRFRA